MRSTASYSSVWYGFSRVGGRISLTEAMEAKIPREAIPDTAVPTTAYWVECNSKTDDLAQLSGNCALHIKPGNEMRERENVLPQ